MPPLGGRNRLKENSTIPSSPLSSTAPTLSLGTQCMLTLASSIKSERRSKAQHTVSMNCTLKQHSLPQQSVFTLTLWFYSLVLWKQTQSKKVLDHHRSVVWKPSLFCNIAFDRNPNEFVSLTLQQLNKWFKRSSKQKELIKKNNNLMLAVIVIV